MHILQCK